MDFLDRDEHGWPVWPPTDSAIMESLMQVWKSGDWGRYHSDIARQCCDAIASWWQSAPSGLSDLASANVRLCSSGTMAVELALRGVGVQGGDEVVLCAYDYPGNLRCIELLSAKPVLVDVQDDGVTMCVGSLRKVTGDPIKAVVVSHLYGQLANTKAIRQVCDERGWALIEDACQVPGAGTVDEGQFTPVGEFADAVTLSFGGSKPLTAGCGGAVMTRDGAIASRIRAYADRPSDTPAMSPLQCAALLPQLARLDEMNRRRSKVVGQLQELDWASVGGFALSGTDASVRSCHYKFAIQVADPGQRSELLRRFESIGLPVGEGFRSADRMSPRRARQPVPLPLARRLAEQVLLIDHRVLLADDLVERLGSCGIGK
ncbi:dTDP-4-amino-4,6-dideoxygalactose transaminase [Neorhodopirellula lusitana]|uniref:dTDP-4-amino-4,6-dideoxygalactose transaminase n=1 Tax=Neorhodopirellula lusitana TaxID=445327 RepID=A0ABY1PVS1_9BACT|nr:DegT/DnrJ/EryC1/StrS family aminotransferase [Neorhodopirellula lusitana]SMP48459.1 dTDP-4-amino-4,6-dideoxygalactose transaminase [Neorhodopirellula lusitana]